MHAHTITRRTWLKSAAALTAGVGLAGAVRRALADADGQPTIMLRSGWQTVNIGDITHTPGVLKLLRDHLPDVHVIAWMRSFDRGVGPMLEKAFPEVDFVTDDAEAHELFEQTDLLLHGSGPSVVAARDLMDWRDRTDKPFGTYGVTIGSVSDTLRDLLNDAAFVFCRETASYDVLEEAGVTEPAIDFAPDGTFAFHLRDDEKGLAFLEEHGLEEDRFICVIPRLRYTPYHEIRPNGAGWSEEKIAHVEQTNEEFGEKDHAKKREAMIRWVRETGHKVLVCPEMTYQLDVMDELLIDPLPDDVKPHVVKRDTYWMPDEAASVYRRAKVVISAECHSPIIASAQDTPSFYVRQPTDTIKGQMYYDIGVADWVFEVDEVEGKDIADRLMAVHEDYPAAQAKLAEAMDVVHQQHTQTMALAGETAS